MIPWLPACFRAFLSSMYNSSEKTPVELVLTLFLSHSSGTVTDRVILSPFSFVQTKSITCHPGSGCAVSSVQPQKSKSAMNMRMRSNLCIVFIRIFSYMLSISRKLLQVVLCHEISVGQNSLLFTKVIIPQVEPLSVYLYNCHRAELFQGEFLHFRLRMSLLHGFLLYVIYFYYTASVSSFTITLLALDRWYLIYYCEFVAKLLMSSIESAIQLLRNRT